MTSIAGNSGNKHLADFCSQQKRHGSRINTATKRTEDMDDNRSEASYISYASSSNFSSVMKKGPLNHDLSQLIPPSPQTSFMGHSQISYEDGFPNAEFNAVTEEERARRRKEDKDQKMKDFVNKTKKNAQTKFVQDQHAKQNALYDQQMKDRERVLKAKDYARKQREIIKQQAESKKGGAV